MPFDPRQTVRIPVARDDREGVEAIDATAEARPEPIERIFFTASRSRAAQEAMRRLEQRYGTVEPADAQVIVALGGDGFMLETLHRFISKGPPIYGMNRGSVGFLMNEYREDGLLERLESAQPTSLHPLRMLATCEDGTTTEALAINEVSLHRQGRQAAKIRIVVDGVVRLEELTCDGVLLATPAGSTAYNLSAHGPILPVGASMLALTPVSAFRPRRWRGALLPARAHVRFETLERWKRPVSAVADDSEATNVAVVDAHEDRDLALTVLFDRGHDLDERILREQFGF